MRRQKQALQRMKQLEIARGMSSWIEFAIEKRRLLHAFRLLKNTGLSRCWRSWTQAVGEWRVLRSAIERMRNPMMSFAFGKWRRFSYDEFRRAAAEKTLAARAEFDMLQQRCAEVKSALDERDAVNARARQRLDDALTAGQRGTGGEGDAK